MSGSLRRSSRHLKRRRIAPGTSARFLGLELATVQAKVDAILGWQSFAQRIREAGAVVTL